MGVNMNCWEYMKCGREKGGDNADEQGVCPVYPNDGMRCAFVAGTLCSGVATGTFARKISSCRLCPFFFSAFFDTQVLKRGDDSEASGQ
jgi:hypothetical protein